MPPKRIIPLKERLASAMRARIRAHDEVRSGGFLGGRSAMERQNRLLADTYFAKQKRAYARRFPQPAASFGDLRKETVKRRQTRALELKQLRVLKRK